MFLLGMAKFSVPTATCEEKCIPCCLAWLKKRMQLLELRRRGWRVHYTPVSVVKAAIHVSITTLMSM